MIRLSLAEGDRFLSTTEIETITEILAFDPVYATRSITDVIPNPGARGR